MSTKRGIEADGRKYYARCMDCHENLATDHKVLAEHFVSIHKKHAHVAILYVLVEDKGEIGYAKSKTQPD